MPERSWIEFDGGIRVSKGRYDLFCESESLPDLVDRLCQGIKDPRAQFEEYKKCMPSVRELDGRIVFCGGLWDEWDISFCVHGEKLRWQCDECEQALAAVKEKE